jgi:hypothetical protein
MQGCQLFYAILRPFLQLLRSARVARVEASGNSRPLMMVDNDWQHQEEPSILSINPTNKM